MKDAAGDAISSGSNQSILGSYMGGLKKPAISNIIDGKDSKKNGSGSGSGASGNKSWKGSVNSKSKNGSGSGSGGYVSSGGSGSYGRVSDPKRFMMKQQIEFSKI